MKTSKKILSFFLAVVMVVTTCSIGFTAFAAENKKSIWSTDADADAAFASIDGLVNSYLPGLLFGVGNVADAIYAKYAGDYNTTAENLTDDQKEEIKNSKATIADVLETLVPTLLNVDVSFLQFEIFGLKMSQQEFVDKYHPGTKAYHYDYLATATEGEVDFFTLYNICDKLLNDKAYIEGTNDDGVKAELSSDAKAQLAEWFEELKAFDRMYADLSKRLSSLGDVAVEIARAADPSYNTKSLEELKALTFNFDGKEEDIEAYIEYQKAVYDANFCEGFISENASLNERFAQAIYYYTGSAGEKRIDVAAYDHLLQIAEANVVINKSVNFTIDGQTQSVAINESGINAENICEKLTPAILAAFGLEDNALNRSKAEITIFNLYQDILKTGDGYVGNYTPSASEYYPDYLRAAAVLSGKYTNESYEAAVAADIDYPDITKEIRTEIAQDIVAFVKGSELGRWAVSNKDGAGFEAINQQMMIDYFTAENTVFHSYYGDTPVEKLAVKYVELDQRKVVVQYFTGPAAAQTITNKISNVAKDITNCQNFVNNIARMYSRIFIANEATDNKYLRTVAAATAQGTNINADTLGTRDHLLISSFSTDNSVGVADELVNDRFDYSVEIELSPEEQFKPSDYNLMSKTGIEIVNVAVNKVIGSFMGLIGVVFNGSLTKIDIDTALMNIIQRLYDSPTSTVIELLPVLVVILDEILIPTIFNDPEIIANKEIANKDIYEAAELVQSLGVSAVMSLLGGTSGLTNGALLPSFSEGYKLTDHSAAGVDDTYFDLNQILPALLHWLYEGADAENATYYGSLVTTDTPLALVDGSSSRTYALSGNGFKVEAGDLAYYQAIDADGNELTADLQYKGVKYDSIEAVAAAYPNATFTYYMTYESNVPYITGVYALDKMLRDADVKDLSKILANKAGETAGPILAEVIEEIGKLFMTAVDTYLADPELANQVRADKNGKLVNKGLNNLFVAIPQLFDIMEDLAAEKYNGNPDNWTYCYDGKIETIEGGSTVNTIYERFKSYAATDDPDRAVDILDCFSEVLVENWIDAVLSLINGTLTNDNEISNNIPIISGLINALGGFGEESIFTDIFNGVFLLTRDNEYSFTFTDELTDENNKLTGLTKKNAYFLLANIDRLVEVITNLIAHFDSNASTASVEDAASTFSGGAITTFASSASGAPAAKATSSKYSSSDLSNAKDLIENLDEMLSSLLSDSTINGFSIDSAENIIAGIVSLLDNFLGNDIKVDDELTTEIVKLVNQYLYFITGESDNLTASNKDVNPKKVYTNNALTGLVVETYALIEKIVDLALAKFNDDYNIGTADAAQKTQYNLLSEAIEGVFSPDAVGIRLGDYEDAHSKFAKYNSWITMSEDSARHDYKNLRIDWKFKDGDKEGFYKGFASSLRLVTTLFGVLLIDTGWYDTVVAPILGALCDKNGVKVTPYEELVADKEATGYYDATLIAVLEALSGWANSLLGAPVTTLIQTVQGVAGILDDNNKKAGTISSIIEGALAPIVKELVGAGSIFGLEPDPANGLQATSPTLDALLNGFADIVGQYADPDGIVIGGYVLNGTNLIPILNSVLDGTGITLKQISWSKIYSSTPEAALVYYLEYVLETLLESGILDLVLGLIKNDTVTAIFDALKANKVDAKGLLSILNRVLEATDSPTLAYWTFAQYLQELTYNFKYPAGITKAMADEGVPTLDNLVAQIFPLLQSFGVDLGADDLKGIVDKNLFKNELLTKLAVALYGALDGLDPTIKNLLKTLGIVTSTKDVAAILTDSSYGATYSSAANTIKAQSSWKNVKNVNWGFTDGSAKAQQGFVNALAAILRPLDDILAIFLNEGTLQLNDIAYDAICAINVAPTTAEFEISGNITIKLTYSMKNGVFTLKIDDAQRELSKASEIKLDLKALKAAEDLKIVGSNGYNSAIIPLLEAFKCSGIKTYSEYKSDVSKAKDNLLLDILNPIAGASDNSLINKLLDKPFAVLCDLLPNIAMYLDAHGLSQLLDNLLAPITGLVEDIDKVLDINGIVKAAAGQDLNGLLSSLINNALGTKVKLNVNLSDLSTINIESLIYPIVTALISGSDNETVKNLKLYKIDFNALIALGTKGTYTSKATGANGNYLTGKTLNNVDQGKVLITVLRYIAKTLTANATTLKNIILNIDGLKKNKSYDLIASILSSVFNTLSTASADQLVSAIFYLVSSQPRNAFWDYTSYKTGDYTFAYPENMDVDFLKNLPPMLDGLIGGLLDLNGLIADNLFKDELVSKLATALYGAIEGVKVGDGTLTALLAQTDIDFSTANVANLLVDKDYGKTFESASATIKAAGSWKNVKAESLKWGVTDRDSFFHALVAVLRPLYGVLDVLLNDAYLGLFDLVRIPGSNGYTSSIVPLMEAFSMYNIKTQYQYRQDMSKEYDAILLDIINPLWDFVEDVLNAPIQTIAAVVPNLALFIGNNGLCQIIDNLLAPISALADAIRPIVDLNDLLNTLFKSLKFDLNGTLAKIGVKNFTLDVYDLSKTLKPILSGDALIPLINNILGLIKIGGTPLGLKLNDVDWLQLASHGTTIISASQAATYGSRIFVQGDSSETLIAVLRYLIDTINAGDNFDKINSLISGLLGDSANETVSGVINQVLGMLQDDTDTVISSLVELLQTLA